jgi:hypothetical protein
MVTEVFPKCISLDPRTIESGGDFLVGCAKIRFYSLARPPQMYRRVLASWRYERQIILGAFFPAC